MAEHRLTSHPILDCPEQPEVPFTWNGDELHGVAGEMISSALIANGIHIFGHHPRDGSPQGLFCANGQCSQCLVIADGKPVKSCMTPLRAGMELQSVEGLPSLPAVDEPPEVAGVEIEEVEVLVIGAGPAGLSAAIELGREGVEVLIVDDKDRPGGKLVLQTHKFFGSVEDSWAGTRGYQIAEILAEEVAGLPTVQLALETTAVGVFSDRIVGLVSGGRYRLVRPQGLLVAAGAREKMLPFPGNTLPGVIGAGAFQTLVNRDLIRPCERLLIVGGGNVGLIAGYHAIQAGIEVVALIEALPHVGGYVVHADKLRRLGVPIFTRHTVTAAHGTDHVEAVTIAELDENWQVVEGTDRTFEVDTVLIAVGLTEVNEFALKAAAFGLPVRSAGDAQEIAEASAAMFSGRIEGRELARLLGREVGEIPREWREKVTVLKSLPGKVEPFRHPEPDSGVMPVLHCRQEVPCNPCTSVCPQGAIHTEDDTITGLPFFDEGAGCTGCMNCVGICPALAVTLVDYRNDPEHPTVTLPYEIWRDKVEKGHRVMITDEEGAVLGEYEVQRVMAPKKYPGTLLVQVAMEPEKAKLAAGVWVQEADRDPLEVWQTEPLPDEAIVCRCERVTAGEIRARIQAGLRDLNEIKTVTRAGMGACGSKTCRPMILRLFAEEGIDPGEVTDRTDRPLFVEVPLGTLAGLTEEQDSDRA